MKKRTVLMVACLNIIIGGFFFALNNNIIIIRYPGKQQRLEQTALNKQLLRFSYWKNNTLHYEWRPIIKDENDIITAQRIITMYWLILEDCGILNSRITTQAVTADRTEKILICSLSANPCSPEYSVNEAWLILEGLINTLRELMPRFQKIWFLVNHQPLKHPSLDCSRPWPFEGFSGIATFSSTQPMPLKPPLTQPLQNITLYLNPAGSPYNPGRTVDNQFERGLALTCAQALKDELLRHNPALRIIINPAREEAANHYHTISHAHRLQANMYLHISFYQSHNPTPELTITTFQWHPVTDLWKREKKPGEFVPIHEAHLAVASYSSRIAHHMFHHAATTRPFPLLALAQVALPYAPLVGLQVPAVGFEIGIQHKQDIAAIIPALALLIEEGIGQISYALEFTG
jgi:hypothetical protein